ncbi:uncharacterized protein LOC105188297 isoform X2 [Harpegnathos saltator]|uniref:uncharacterized protein LOC105188297 isoform X2 n=1 Tax=Harpegnathos saltator TaxID=610380 RepID=UPI000948D0C8|nr:uncharacterized protein LOC105188297 isoform X2 [Harpegnathos saltator]
MGNPVHNREPFNIYPADKERNIRVIRWLLKSICLWPRSSNASIVDRVFSECLLVTCFFLLIITMVSCGRVLFVKERADVDLLMTHIGPFLCYVMTIMKYICLVLHVDDIRSCVKYIEVDWNTVRSNEDYEVMLRNAKIGGLMATSIAAFMHCAVQFYSVTRCLMKNVVEVDNVSVTIRELPYPFYNEILDVRFSPAYELVLVLHVVSAFVMSGVTSVTCGLMVIFVMHACGQLKILIIWLNDIVQDNDAINISTVQRKMGFIVEHHLKFCVPHRGSNISDMFRGSGRRFADIVSPRILFYHGMESKQKRKHRNVLYSRLFFFVQYFYNLLHCRNSQRTVQTCWYSDLYVGVVSSTSENCYRSSSDKFEV